MSTPTDSGDNAEIQAGLKRAEPIMLIFILTILDFIITLRIHQIFPYQAGFLPPKIGFFWDNYFFLLIVLFQSLIFYSIAARYRPPDAET